MDREGRKLIQPCECRYHGIEGNEYPLPNDTEEHTRLDSLQYMFRNLLGRNVVSPISSTPTRILDVGAGSGRWVAEVAEEFPSATVTGLDLSPIDPPGNVPKNCEFMVGDLTHGLKFDDRSLDLVHSR